MRRFLSALTFCTCLLVAISFVLFPPVRAKEDPIAALLDLPAPPPPNPLVSPYRARDKDFYNKYKPPKDDAPIDELLEYWRNRSESYNQLGGEVTPSEKTLERIMREIERDHKLLTPYMNILPDGDASERFVRGLMDNEGSSGVYDKEARDAIKSWMYYHTAAYSEELRQAADDVHDQDEYLTAQTELLALSRVDFAKAEPILNRLYNDSTQKTSQTLAKWALYHHAIDTNSLDVDKYRDELKAVVEDKAATAGMRDLALDALSKEKDWPGRDEWYLSLLSDETLTDLKVNGSSYTGLTTMMYYVPDDRLTDKMLEMLKSDNKTVRANVVRNLLLKLETGGIELVRAMVPWLEDPKWANDTANSRYTLVNKLSDFEIPESVPGLIKTLDEQRSRPATNTMSNSTTSASESRYYANSANTIANARASMANSAAALRAAANSNTAYSTTYESEMDDYSRYPLRDISIAALAKQKDPRAVPALKHVLSEVQYYQQTTVVRALIECKGFTIAEQLDGLELVAKSVRSEIEGTPTADPLANLYSYSNSNSNAGASHAVKRAPTALELKAMVGRELTNVTEIPDDLARAVVDRIATLDKTDKPLGDAMRRIAMKWQGPVINLLLLSDLKNGRSDSESILKLLSQRTAIREKQSADVFDIRTGSQTALGISSCLLEEQNDAATMLENSSAEAKTALLACARLIRLPLPIDKVAANLTSQTPILITAAERYLESEDSPTARSIVLSRHAGEARITGATSAFFVSGVGETSSEMLSNLYASLGDNSLYNGWYGSGNDEDIRLFEKTVQDEIKKTPELIAMYAYDGNYIRIYKDKVVYSFDEDSSRYRERPLEKHEFDEIKAYIHDSKLDDLPPFLNCGGEYCEAKELLMLGKNGGRRVYVNGDSAGVFDGLAKLFEGMKKAPATLHYSLSRDLKGLEILIASEDLHAETVWKDGTELKIAASQTAVRKKIENDVAKLNEQQDGSEGIEERKQKLRDKHEYDGYGWYRVTPNGTEPGATQPPGVDIIPVRDGLAVQAGLAQWMRRAPGFEIRASAEGLFKVVRGRMAKLRTGFYDSPVVTPNGRWAIVSKGDPETETGQSLVIVDLITNKERVVEIPNKLSMTPSAYVSSINKVLLKPLQYYGDAEYYETVPKDIAPDDAAPDSMLLVDPATGVVQPIAGEFRPLDQQTFRPLQSTGRPSEFWAAIYDLEKNVTEVGYYETKTFGFRPVLKVPKIKFNSMSMYVDEPANKVYFVYRGHLLSLPLTAKAEVQPLPSPK